MGKYGRIIVFLLFPFGLFAQDEKAADEAFKYKLDYNVPESPGLSVLDANPTKVMRGSAAQELIVSVANSFISSEKLRPGIAADFNPYFLLGGRLESVQEYREKDFKRILANTQLSLATSADEDQEDDLLLGTGIRITLFDKKDLLFNEEFGKKIDDALLQGIADDTIVIGEAVDEVVENKSLATIYEEERAALKKEAGNALSVGFAHGARAQSAFVKADSISAYKTQAWLSFQRDFLRTEQQNGGLSLTFLAMYRNNAFEIEGDVDEFIAGSGLRYTGQKVNAFGEFIYSTEHGKLDYNANLEVNVIKQLILSLTVGKETEVLDSDQERFSVKPGLRWNLSEPKSN